MRALVQRVTHAEVNVGGETVGRIGHGVVVLVGVGNEDGRDEAELLAAKLATLRMFSDGEGKTNLSLLDVEGSALVVSQFTLCADMRKGRRPSFGGAAPPGPAEELVEEFRGALEEQGVPTTQGRFGADMQVSLTNDGPFTLLLDTDELRRPRSG